MINIIPVLKPKNSTATTSSTGSVINKGGSVVNSDTKTVNLNGADINPNTVTTNVVNTTEINSTQINNSGSITTNNITSNTANITNLTVNGSISTPKLDVSDFAHINEIESNSIWSDHINASDLEISNWSRFEGDAQFDSNVNIDGDLRTSNIYNSEKITTKDLEVTGTAHFWELVVDKIKSVGGSIILSPADGFTINDITFEDCIYNGQQLTGMPCLWFKATDDDRNISNGWDINDMAICANFNEVHAGVNIDVSNNYWWYLVASTNNDTNNDLTVTPGEAVDHDYDGEDPVPSHFIILNTNYKDPSSMLINSSTKDKQIGNDVAMLGHYKLDTTSPDREERRSAIWLSAYSNILDTGLKAPLWAHYVGINDFVDLAGFRKTKFDANGGEIIGDLRVQSGQSVEDYIADQLANIDTGVPHVEIERNADGRVYDIILISDELNRVYDFTPLNTLKIKMYDADDLPVQLSQWKNTSTLKIFGQTFNIRAGSQTLGGITVTFTANGQYEMQCTISKTNTYVELSAASSIEVTVMTDNRGNARGYVSINVVSKIEGADAEVYQIFKDTELCNVDANKTLNVDIRYGIFHIIGADGEYITPSSSMKLRVDCYSATNAIISSKSRTLNANQFVTDGSAKNGVGYWRYFDTITGWYDLLPQNQPSYYVIKLLKNNGTDDEIIDSSYVSVSLYSGALFIVQDDLIDQIVSTREFLDGKIEDKYSELRQTVDDITATVNRHTTNIDSLTGRVDSTETQIGQLQVRADAIEATVSDNYNDLIGRLDDDNSACVVLDLKDFNQNTWYPAIVDLSTIPNVGEQNKIIYNIQVDRTLDSSANGYGTPDYGNTQSGVKRGFDLLCKWQAYRSNYGEFDGTTDKSIYVTDYVLRWTALKNAEQDNETKIIGNIQQQSNASTIVYYLRGGSKYNVRIDYWWKNDQGATISPSNYIKVFRSGTTIGNINYPIINNASQITIPTSDRMHKSEILQTAENISLTVYSEEWSETDAKLRATGINIDTHNITLNADNTIINGNLELNDSDTGFSFNDDGEEKLNISTNHIPSKSLILPTESNSNISKQFPNVATLGWSYDGSSSSFQVTIGSSAQGASESIAFYDIDLSRCNYGETVKYTAKELIVKLNQITAGRNGTTFTPTITGMIFGGSIYDGDTGYRLSSTYSDTSQVNSPGTFSVANGNTWKIRDGFDVTYTNDNENYNIAHAVFRGYATVSYTVSPHESGTTFSTGSGSITINGKAYHSGANKGYIGTNGLAFVNDDRYIYVSDSALAFYAGGVKVEQQYSGQLKVSIGDTEQSRDSGNAMYNYAASETQIERQGVVIVRPATSGTYSRYTVRTADKTILAYPTANSGYGKIEIESLQNANMIGHVHYLKNMGNGTVQLNGDCVVGNSKNTVQNYNITDHYMYLIINCGTFITVNKIG